MNEGTLPLMYYAAQVTDPKTRRRFRLRVCAPDARAAADRFKWLGFMVSELNETDPPRSDPKLKTGQSFSTDYTGESFNLGEVFEASFATTNREAGALDRMLHAVNIEWTRGEDRHGLLQAIAHALGKAGDSRFEVVAWQWMAELPEFKEHLRGDPDAPVSAENVVRLLVPHFLSEYLQEERHPQRAAEVGLLVGEALRGEPRERTTEEERLRQDWVALQVRLWSGEDEAEAEMESIQERLGYGPVLD